MNHKVPVQTFALLVLEHTSSKYSYSALFCLTVFPSYSQWNQLICSVAAPTKLDLNSSVVAWKWRRHYPETDLVQAQRGQTRSLPHTALHFGLYELNETQTDSLGLRVQILKEERLAD